MPTLNTLKILAPLAVVASLAISPGFGTTKGTAGKKAHARTGMGVLQGKARRAVRVGSDPVAVCRRRLVHEEIWLQPLRN